MKLSIWPQFSSNHSSNFTVVGTFETPEKAQQALVEMRDIVESIRRSYRDKQGISPGGTVEREIAMKYGVEWKSSAAWLIEGLTLDLFMRDDVIMLANVEEVGSGPAPLDQIMEKLGARIAIDNAETGGNTLLGVDLSCVAPDEATAGKIFSAASRQFADPDGEDVYVPWGTVHRSGAVERDGLTLTFTGLTFDIFEAAFPAMVEWLEKHGFSDIKYDFRSVPAPGATWDPGI